MRLLIPARIVLLTARLNCHLEDLSTTGARLAFDNLPDHGAHGVLTIPGPDDMHHPANGRAERRIERFGTIAWRRGRLCGFRFEEPVALVDVVRLRHFADRFGEYRRQQQLRMAREFVQGRRTL